MGQGDVEHKELMRKLFQISERPDVKLLIQEELISNLMRGEPVSWNLATNNTFERLIARGKAKEILEHRKE